MRIERDCLNVRNQLSVFIVTMASLDVGQHVPASRDTERQPGWNAEDVGLYYPVIA